jgi:putative ABC transport system permease protein
MFFPILFLGAAAMAAYVMISRLVWSQRPTIGVMVANGFTRRRVLTHYLGYGLVPGLAGAIPGAIAGVLLARVITDLYTNLLSVPVTLIEFYPTTLITGVVFGLLTAILAALAPALFASRVKPALAMRGETPARAGRMSIPERILPPLRRLPTRWRMVLRGIERNPRRTAYTIIGVVLSLTLVLVSWGMIDTVEHLVDLQFLEIQREDATVHFTGPVAADDVADLVAIDGIAAAEPVLELPVSISAGGDHYDTALLAVEADTTMHGFLAPGGEWIDLPTEGVLVGEALEGLLGVGAGDTVDLTIAPLGITVREEVAGFVAEPLGTLAYMSRDRAAVLSGGAVPATSAMIAYDHGVDVDAVRTTVTALPTVAAFDDAKALYSMVQEYLVLFYAFVGVMLVFGAAMAFALIFNAMSVNIAERSREIATLLAVGTKRRSISRLITAENLLVAAAGIPLGLVIGYFVSKAAMSTFSSDMFTFPLFIRTSTFVWTAAAIVVVALVSQWPGLRALRRLEIAKIVKERSV